MESCRLVGKSIKLGVDLDGTLLDFDQKLFDEFNKQGIHFKDLGDMGTQVRQNPEVLEQQKKIYHKEKFYENISPIEGAIEAFNYLNNVKDANGKKIFEIFIVSTPSIKNPTCHTDKVNDIKKYFGEKVADRMVLTGDKTIIGVDIQIDDRKYLVGIDGSSKNNELSYEHIRFWSPMCDYENTNFPLIKNWTDETFKKVIMDVCIKKGLLVQ